MRHSFDNLKWPAVPQAVTNGPAGAAEFGEA
jgi:hypothetical protein